jgi:hypothetical protein
MSKCVFRDARPPSASENHAEGAARIIFPRAAEEGLRIVGLNRAVFGMPARARRTLVAFLLHFPLSSSATLPGCVIESEHFQTDQR